MCSPCCDPAPERQRDGRAANEVYEFRLLIDHIVRPETSKFWRNCEAQSLGRLEVDDEINCSAAPLTLNDLQ